MMTNTPDTNHASQPPTIADARDRQLDNTFAELTDALLSGQSINSATVDPALSELLKVSRQLKTLIIDDPGPSAAFHARLSRKLTEEWDKERFRRRTNRPRMIQRVALAAALILMVGGAVLWFSSPNIPATAVGPIPPEFYAVVAVVGAVAGLALIVFGLTRRK
ncbi:MAG: hypothetical protein ACYDBJ_01535 [Aggregatilineales bacterium]